MSGCATLGLKQGEVEMNARTMVHRIALLALTIAPTVFVAAKEPLSIRVSPAVSFAPANLVILTRVEPDADNRAIEIVADSDDFYRASAVQLDGDQAPKTVSFVFRSVPPGDYAVSASVIGTNGQPKAIARAHAHVIESGSSR